MREHYFLEAEKDLTTFEFISEGVNGRFEITIQYSQTNIRGIYNLGFGAINKDTGTISDTIILNNGDTQKILSTVASSVYAFIDKYPHASILIKGSTSARTRLYRMGITLNLSEIQKDFEVLGFKNGHWHPFKKNETYEAFLVNQKK
jgi:hypothetical protein